MTIAATKPAASVASAASAGDAAQGRREAPIGWQEYITEQEIGRVERLLAEAEVLPDLRSILAYLAEAREANSSAANPVFDVNLQAWVLWLWSTPTAPTLS